jgi:DNA polymerase-3 subunit epsilon
MSSTPVRPRSGRVRQLLDQPPAQGSFDELGTPLREVTFCVVDLETTGGSAAAGAAVTEIGAVKVRAGELLGEFQTLVDPAQPIPGFVAVLTGITDSMVRGAPSIAAALPAFLEFAAGCVLVAHNAPFDLGFLRHYAAQLGHPWPAFPVLDTASLARRVLTRDDAPNCKLATLARVFRASTEPDHRALHDARATVDVLHGLIGRLGGVGVQTLEELQAFSARVSQAQRGKRHLAETMPAAPGVYLFAGASGEVLYVGTSKDLRKRVRSYFTASETRSRMGEMVALAESVQGIECATALEARVRELRLLGEHKPRYNRRSRFPERVTWVKVTVEPWPRLSLVRAVSNDGAVYLGPFSARRAAEQAVAALQETFRVRQCSDRLPRAPSRTACVLAQMHRCLSPCDGSVEVSRYAEEVAGLRQALSVDAAPVVEALTARMATYVGAERFEEAALYRDRLLAFLRGATRSQRLYALAGCAELVAARRSDEGRWEVHVVRHGRLAAAGVIPPGAAAGPWVTALRESAETVRAGPGRTAAASAEEAEAILRWLEQPGVRLVAVDGTWASPVGGAQGQLVRHESAAAGRSTLVPFDDRRDLRLEHQPHTRGCGDAARADPATGR